MPTIQTMAGPADAPPGLITADQVCDRLAEEPALQAASALCVLPMVWVEGRGVRFCRADLEAWIAREYAIRARRSRATLT